MKAQNFKSWLLENEIDVERLIDLGLFREPVVEWYVSVSPSVYVQSGNPMIGVIDLHPDWGDQEKFHTFTLYPSSFNDSDEVKEIIRKIFYKEATNQDLIDWIGKPSRIRELVDLYAPEWARFWSGSFWAKNRNTGSWLAVPPSG